MSALIVRRLDMARDFVAARDIRLEALSTYPQAFAADLDTEAALSAEQWVARAKDVIWFGGFVGDALMGTIIFVQSPRPKLKHTGNLGGMYVRSAVRGQGLGDALIVAALDAAKTAQCEQVSLTVNADNPHAIALYERHGFRTTGRLPNALRVGAHTYDELTMLCVFEKSA